MDIFTFQYGSTYIKDVSSNLTNPANLHSSMVLLILKKIDKVFTGDINLHSSMVLLI